MKLVACGRLCDGNAGRTDIALLFVGKREPDCY